MAPAEESALKVTDGLPALTVEIDVLYESPKIPDFYTYAMKYSPQNK
jgi:hypothetical protein